MSKSNLIWEHYPAGRHDLEVWKARCGKHLFIIEKWPHGFAVEKYEYPIKPLAWEETNELDAAKAICQEWREEEDDV